jgi:hypothetical protein
MNIIEYNSETLQEIYEEFSTSDDPQAYFDLLSEEVQTALIKIYAPEAWEALNNITETTVTVTYEH